MWWCEWTWCYVVWTIRACHWWSDKITKANGLGSYWWTVLKHRFRFTSCPWPTSSTSMVLDILAMSSEWKPENLQSLSWVHYRCNPATPATLPIAALLTGSWCGLKKSVPYGTNSSGLGPLVWDIATWQKAGHVHHTEYKGKVAVNRKRKQKRCGSSSEEQAGVLPAFSSVK